MASCKLMLLAIVTIMVFTIPSVAGFFSKEGKACEPAKCEMDCQEKYSGKKKNTNGATGNCMGGSDGHGCYCSFVYFENPIHEHHAFLYKRTGGIATHGNLQCDQHKCHGNCMYEFPVAQRAGESTGRELTQGKCKHDDTCICIVDTGHGHQKDVERKNYGYFNHVGK